MSDDLDMIADGLALFQEHAPQTAEDWVGVARRFNADGGDRGLSSPLFAALSLAVERLDARVSENRDYVYRVHIDLGRDGVGVTGLMVRDEAVKFAGAHGEDAWVERAPLGAWEKIEQ